MRAEELPALSCHSQCFLTPLSSSRTLSMHKDLEKFPGKAVQSRHTFQLPAFTAWLSAFGRTPRAHLVELKTHHHSVGMNPRNAASGVEMF